MKNHFIVLLLLYLVLLASRSDAQISLLTSLESPIIFKGDDTTAYRDPAILFHENTFFLFFTLVKTENGRIYSYTATSQSSDLLQWSPVKIITERDQALNYCSPGNVIRFGGEWILCLQTYPRPDYTADQKPRYGTSESRLYTMRSRDLVNWSSPEIMMVKGPDVQIADLGRMIDPYLLEDKDEKGKWWCFYKQNGVSMSYSHDLKNWTLFGHTESGENVCVLSEKDEYILFHSPPNGIAIKRSSNLENWSNFGNLITLGQNEWDWAKGRISAGTVVNLKNNEKLGKYVMFFHGSGPKTEEQGDFDRNASLGIAWSDDLINWEWPGKKR
ncbi:MAG: hypothetical protein IPL46_29830 [Saprospiraceae bacterium]|nr:hypothetical protein [Saprospiraceae bacterium]